MKIEIEVDNYAVACALASGMEGGIGYWAHITGEETPTELTWMLDLLRRARFPKSTSELRVYPHIDYPLNPGGGIQLTSADGDVVWLRLADIRRGLAVMAEKYPMHFGHLLSETESDSTTGDVLIQCSVFGEVRYG